MLKDDGRKFVLRKREILWDEKESGKVLEMEERAFWVLNFFEFSAWSF